jgi:predicted ATP-grasp superfamily ATP-dependent carboligase
MDGSHKAYSNGSRPKADVLNVLQLGKPLQVARCLGKTPNVRLHVAAPPRDRWSGVRFSRYASSFHVLDGIDGDQTLDTLYDIAKRTKAEVILPASESPTRFVSVHQDVLSQFITVPPSPAPDVLDMVSDKWLFTSHLARHGLSHPPTVLCTADASFERKLTEVSFPVLLKPRQDLMDGRGIRRIDDAQRLRTFLQENPEYLEGYIVQSFIRGHDVGCSVLCQEGEILAYTIQRGVVPSARPYTPAAVIEFVKDEQVLDLVTRLVSGLKWSGVANIDTRYDEESKQVRALEFNPRYWGSLLGSLSAGVNFPYLHCLAGFGLRFPRPVYSNKRYLVKEPWKQLHAFKNRGDPQKRIAVGETQLRDQLADPLPHVAKLVLKKNPLGRMVLARSS